MQGRERAGMDWQERLGKLGTVKDGKVSELSGTAGQERLGWGWMGPARQDRSGLAGVVECAHEDPSHEPTVHLRVNLRIENRLG